MARKRPAVLSVVGWASVSLGAAWLLWLIFGRRQEILDLLQAGSGDVAAAGRLARRGLAGAGAVYVTVLLLLLEVALAVLWATAGVAVLFHRPFARRAATAACYGTVAVEAVNSALRAFLLVPQGQPIPLLPLIVSGLVTVAAVVLWGGLSLPEAEAAYAGPAGAGAETE
jgi:hypothetical protein